MILELKGVTKNYDKPILNNVNCIFENGVYGLLGPNGAGKSTMIRLICNLEAPTSGEILLDGVPIRELDEQYRSLLGYVPQRIGYYPDFTAREFLHYFSILKGIPKNEVKGRIEDVLSQVNLLDIGKQKIKNFSGGMKQRLCIAQAILNNPRILILDEPTVGLDIEERMKFKQFISEYADNRIVILVTHIVTDVEDIGNEILILKNGNVKVQSTPEDLLISMQGKVWECICTKEEAADLKKRYTVSNVKTRGEYIELRVVANNQPTKNAFLVEGNLQDLYLYILENDKEIE